MAVDAEQVYFFAETSAPLTPHTGNHWMLLLIDADRNPNTGWYGYDCLINHTIVDADTTTLKRYAADSTGGSWVEQAQLKFAAAGNKLELAVPRSLLGCEGNAFSFDFHWCDNPADLKNPLSLCTHGDSAPNRRFNYRCIWEAP